MLSLRAASGPTRQRDTAAGLLEWHRITHPQGVRYVRGVGLEEQHRTIPDDGVTCEAASDLESGGVPDLGPGAYAGLATIDARLIRGVDAFVAALEQLPA